MIQTNCTNNDRETGFRYQTNIKPMSDNDNYCITQIIKVDLGKKISVIPKRKQDFTLLSRDVVGRSRPKR